MCHYHFLILHSEVRTIGHIELKGFHKENGTDYIMNLICFLTAVKFTMINVVRIFLMK